MPKSFLFLATFLPFACFSQVQIVSGPMPGYAALNEVGVWMQLSKAVESPQLVFWEPNKPGVIRTAEASEMEMEYSHVVKFRPTDLSPGKTYEYTILLDGDTVTFKESLYFKTQELWQYRSDPPPFKVAIGSCTYINESEYDRPGDPFGSSYGIFNTIADMKPDAMLWLGDNIYLREYDYLTYKGYLHRYSHTRQTASMQKLLRSTHHYAIWDDHDFGPNDANGSWIHKDWALDAFSLFWMNPSYGIPGKPGITSAFPINDIHFFMLDNRYNRTSDDIKSQKPQILGREQIDWLIESLKYSSAPFKMVMVGGQVLNPAKVYENHAQYEEERQYLLNRIIEEKIDGVVFLTGDRHHTELRKIDIEGVVIHDLTVSPLTAQPHEAKNESTQNLVANTVFNEHNFGVLEFSGERLARTLKISIFDKDGTEIWVKEITP